MQNNKKIKMIPIKLQKNFTSKQGEKIHEEIGSKQVHGSYQGCLRHRHPGIVLDNDGAILRGSGAPGERRQHYHQKYGDGELQR